MRQEEVARESARETEDGASYVSSHFVNRYLHFTGLSGSIPPEIGALTSLSVLYVNMQIRVYFLDDIRGSNVIQIYILISHYIYIPLKCVFLYYFNFA